MFPGDKYLLMTCGGLNCVLGDYFGETWFLTKEDAEKNLSEVNENE